MLSTTRAHLHLATSSSTVPTLSTTWISSSHWVTWDVRSVFPSRGITIIKVRDCYKEAWTVTVLLFCAVASWRILILLCVQVSDELCGWFIWCTTQILNSGFQYKCGMWSSSKRNTWSYVLCFSNGTILFRNRYLRSNSSLKISTHEQSIKKLEALGGALGLIWDTGRFHTFHIGWPRLLQDGSGFENIIDTSSLTTVHHEEAHRCR